MNRLSLPAFLLAILFLLNACGVTNRMGSGTSDSISSRSTKDISAIETGVASWYGPDFHGRQTANGEKYDMNGLTAAHRTLPFNTQVLVENLDNGKSIQVRINDRGPFAKDRIIDLSKGAAEKVEMIGPGTARVRIYVVGGTENLPENIKKAQYTVQLGSYNDRAAAEKKSDEIRSSYVEEVTVKGEKYYRVYFGDFYNPAIALEAQQRLEGLGHKGFVKQKGND
ncbi:MAG: septal ring lytic transglycosylase RlpA family protein [Balneolaceae bacterium]|nr:septal ring lytic transglycosylase RlpA family protein [Balneolaceae bacterium]MBO6546000.1 septal ring lytic transglycosylase RlpA family protein [Balneolaceae bacterium]MBO6647396.1 septal ring lytic transglycosylase RlpA family protein [Balneolaceae bacterium]